MAFFYITRTLVEFVTMRDREGGYMDKKRENTPHSFVCTIRGPGYMKKGSKRSRKLFLLAAKKNTHNAWQSLFTQNIP